MLSKLYFPSVLQENIIPWENITPSAVHQNVIFTPVPSQYLYSMPLFWNTVEPRYTEVGYNKILL